jgi:signal transduction histidine kinase
MRYRSLFSEIILIETDPFLVRSMTVLLQSVGYIVRSFPEISSARKSIEKKKPDLIWLSAETSFEDNHQFIRELKSRPDCQVIPILICYAGDDLINASACLNAGADDLIARPVDHTILLLRIRVLLRLKKAAADLVELNNLLEEKVTERTAQLEKANARLRHSEKLSSLGRLASSIVHEINNPLTGMMLNVGLMEDSLPPGSNLQSNVKMLTKSLDQVANLVNQLRAFAKPAEAMREIVAINSTIRGIGNLLEKQFKKDHITIQLELDDSMPDLYLPINQFREVILNLTVNAADAMPQGGLLKLTSRRIESQVEISISDSGEGIPPELIDRIFEPFYSTKGEKGTGLGLTIVYNIIESIGGDISVESQSGVGTRFVILLPVPSLPAEAIPVQEP